MIGLKEGSWVKDGARKRGQRHNGRPEKIGCEATMQYLALILTKLHADIIHDLLESGKAGVDKFEDSMAIIFIVLIVNKHVELIVAKGARGLAFLLLRLVIAYFHILHFFV